MSRLFDFLAMVGGYVIAGGLGMSAVYLWGWPWFVPVLCGFAGAILGTFIRICFLA